MDKDYGRVDELGNKEFLVEVTGGPKKVYNKRRRRNPFFTPPKTVITPKITAQWYQVLVEQLRQERQRQKISQMTLAQQLRTHQSVVSRFERGRTNPSILFLQTYAKALGKSIETKLNT